MQQVKTEDCATYAVKATPDRADAADEDAIIARALSILLARLKSPGVSLSSPHEVRDFLTLKLATLEHEVFAAMFLDAQNRLLDYEEMFRGSLTQTSVYPREIVKAAIARNAYAVIFAHNHPSGSATQSRADEVITQTLKAALATVDISVLDHMIIAGATINSFAESGIL